MKRLVGGCCLLLLLTGVPSTVRAGSQSIDDRFLDRISAANLSSYNRFATPTQYTNGTTEVYLSVFIESMASFSPRTMDYQMDIYLQQEWVDTRLRHNYADRLLLRERNTFDKLWHPDIYFVNSKKASFQDVTTPNFLCWVYNNGTVFFDARVSLTAICMMDLAKYPLDSQVCQLKMMSCSLDHAYDQTQLVLRWSKNLIPVDWNRKVNILDMHVEDVTTEDCTETDGQYATGNWSCVRLFVFVRRQLTHHLMQTYLPSALIVVISWFSFWLDVDAAPARVSLGITTLLTVSTQANTVKMALPEVSYMKAIDVWMGVCLAFVFAAMIEFTACHWARNRCIKTKKNVCITKGLAGALGMAAQAAMAKKKEEDRRKAEAHAKLVNPDGRLYDDNGERLPQLNEIYEQMEAGQGEWAEDSIANNASVTNSRKNTRAMYSLLQNQVISAKDGGMKWLGTLKNIQGRRAAQQIDKRCRRLFPGTFVLFNVVYWVYYLVVANEDHKFRHSASDDDGT